MSQDLFRKRLLPFNTCKRQPPVRDYSIFQFQVVAHGTGSTVLDHIGIYQISE